MIEYASQLSSGGVVRVADLPDDFFEGSAGDNCDSDLAGDATLPILSKPLAHSELHIRFSG